MMIFVDHQMVDALNKSIKYNAKENEYSLTD